MPRVEAPHLSQSVSQVAGLAQEIEFSKERYRTLFECAGDAISVLDADGIIVEVNEQCCETFGVPAEQMVGRHIREFAAPQNAEVQAAFCDAVLHERADRVTLPITRPDGVGLFIETTTRVVQVGGKKLVLAVTRDMTATVQATRALSEAEQRYRSLVERMPDVLWSTSESGAVTFITPNVQKLFGYSPEEVCASPTSVWLDRLHPEDDARVRRAYAELLASETMFDLECRVRCKDERYVWVWARVIGVLHRDGHKQFEGMFSDISDKKQLEAKLALSQKLEAVGQLTGGIAHDFNNILAIVLANCDFLLDAIGPHDQRREDVEQVKLAADRAVVLIRQLLAFSRKQVLAPTVLDLNATVLGMERLCRRLIGEDIEFSVSPACDLGLVRADIGQVEQVVMNLIVNARDAMAEGGKLSIETANVDLETDAASGRPPVLRGRYVMLAITDTGCGMDSATQARMFEPFFTTKERGRGTGLGLATSYGIVKQSGGYIFAESEPGKGTTFRIYLPRVFPEAVSGPRTSVIPASYEGSETVMLLEDDEGVRAVVTRILAGYGYRVLAAGQATEAIACADAHGSKIDLIISDVVMPGMNGPAAVERLQTMCEKARTLFMSGYTDHALLRDGALERKANFIQKPFTPEALVRKVRELLDA